MNDLDEQVTWLESTLNECSKKLSGDLFNDQIEIYDLAFSRAELLSVGNISVKNMRGSLPT